MFVRFEIEPDTSIDVEKIIIDEHGSKFRANVKNHKKKIIIEIQADDYTGLQAGLNSYLEKLKLLKKLDEELG